MAAALPLVALGLLWALVHEHRARLGLGALSACGTLAAQLVAVLDQLRDRPGPDPTDDPAQVVAP